MGSLSTARLASRRWSAAGPLSTAVSFSAGPMVRIRFPPGRSLRTIGSVTASPTTIMGRCRTDRRGQQIQIAVAVSNLYRATEVLRSSGARPAGLRIDRPVVFEKLDPVIERDGFAPIAIDVGDQARALSEKVLCVKIEDRRQIYQPILGIEADVAIFDNEGARRTARGRADHPDELCRRPARGRGLQVDV